MITIKSLSFSNMFSFGLETQTVEFSSPVIQLTGKNGAGKSSIPTILEELFYNKNSRGVKKAEIPNRHSDKKHYSCSAEFEKDGVSYTVTKTVKTTASLKLTKNGEDISGHTTTQTYEILEKLIGLEFNTFSKLVYQSIVSSLDFLTATDANRKKFLVSLLGLERYTEIQDKVKLEASENKQALSASTAKVDMLLSSIDSYKEEPRMVEVAIPADVTSELSEDIGRLSSQLSNIAAYNQEVAANIAAQNRLNALRSELAQWKHAVPKPALTKEALLSEKAQLEGTHKAVKQQLDAVKAAKTHCPTCNRAYEGDFSHQAEKIATYTSELKALADRHSAVKKLIEEYAEYEKYSTKLTELSNAESATDSTKPTTIKDAKQLETQIATLKAEVAKVKSEIASAQSYNKTVAAHNAKLIERRMQVEQNRAALVSELGVKLDLDSRGQKLTVLTDAYGTKGLISYKIETMVKVFESLINEYLQALSNGKFVLTFVVEDTKLTLKLYDDGHEISIGQVSSGEFNKINTATLLAVRKMMTSLSKVDINVLFLDEVVSVLDTESKDTLIGVLLSEPNLNSVVVSHGYKHPLAETIAVIKEGNISRLEHE